MGSPQLFVVVVVVVVVVVLLQLFRQQQGVSSKNYPPVPPVSSSEGCSSQCEQVPVSGSDSVLQNSFFLSSTYFLFLSLHEIHKEKFSRKSRKKKVRPGYQTLESFPEKEIPSNFEVQICLKCEVAPKSEPVDTNLNLRYQ